MKIASVVLFYDVSKGFDYEIPDHLKDDVVIGTFVEVDFRKKKSIGFVIEIKNESDAKNLKKVERRIFNNNLSEEFLKFVKWASEYYFSNMGIIYRQFSISEISVKRDYVCTSKEGENLELYVMSKEKPLLRSEIKKILKSEEKIEELLKTGILKNDIVKFTPPKKRDVTLTDEQENAFEEVKQQIERNEHKTFLLYGKPSTGKTEVYFKLLHHIIENTSKSVLLMFPEIGLADIFFTRITEEFGSLITAKVHSEMTEGEANFYFEKILSKEKRIIVGTRSAVFAPVKNLGLVVIDEEQDLSYKQFDSAPFYNGRDCAVYRGFLADAPVLLVSATPSVESYSNVKSGKYGYFELKRRYMETPQPQVKIIFNTMAHKNIAVHAMDEIAQTLKENRQVLLFLNRRGYLNLYKCAKCGEYFKCDNCSVSYSYHKSQNGFVCHYCGSMKPALSKCPHCGGNIVSAGVWGTEMIESIMSKAFPQAVIERFDTDSTQKRGERKRIIERVVNREVHILIGTQMVSKGYDIPAINTVVILNSDSVINIPDIRSEERFMQMLVQTSGRAGRRERQGVIVVECGPSSLHLKDFIENLDYMRFIEEELLRRREHGFPPFKRMLKIMHKNRERERAFDNLTKIYEQLKEHENKKFRVLPPGFNYVEKINNLYRTEMFVIYSDLAYAKEAVKSLKNLDFEFYVDNDTL